MGHFLMRVLLAFMTVVALLLPLLGTVVAVRTKNWVAAIVSLFMLLLIVSVVESALESLLQSKPAITTR